MNDIKFAGNCEKCGYPQLKKLVVKYRTEEWHLQKHNYEFIPTHILLLFDLAKAKRVARKFIKKYRVNSDDKIILVSQKVIENSLMDDIIHLVGEDDGVDEWWNSGFPLIYYTRNLIKELL